MRHPKTRFHQKESSFLWTLWNEYKKKRWSRQRFWLYGRKRGVLDNFYESIRRRDPSKRVVIAYGAAKFAPGGRNELSVPTTTMYKTCCRHFPTLLIDEFRTTKLYHVDGALLQTIVRKGSKRQVRGLLWYESPTGNKFVNRDMNAALNILRCATEPNRPDFLKRPGDGVLEPKVGKIIRN